MGGELSHDWEQILNQAGFNKTEYFGDWKYAPYDNNDSPPTCLSF
jgi:hypothetical protein